MSKKTDAAEMLGGVFKEITVLVSRKRTDGNYGSYEVAYGATINITPDQDVDVQAKALDVYLTAAVAESMNEKQGAMVEAAPAQAPMASPPATPLQVKTVQEPQRVPIDDSGTEYEVFDVENIEMHTTKNGKLYGKAKGGKFAKWGVSVWEELLTAPPLEWDYDALSDGTTYQVPPGVQAKAVLNEKGQPSKVVEWL